MSRVGDLHPCYINHHVLRDVRGQTLYLDIVAELVDGAALLDARGLTLHNQLDTHRDRVGQRDPLQVHIQRLLVHRRPLDLLQQRGNVGVHLRARQVKPDQHVTTAGLGQHLVEPPPLNGERQRISTQTIHYAGHLAGRAQLLSYPRALLTLNSRLSM